jgi:hypothetical protein
MVTERIPGRPDLINHAHSVRQEPSALAVPGALLYLRL